VVLKIWVWFIVLFIFIPQTHLHSTTPLDLQEKNYQR
jgi:hypothetical protein